MQWLIKQTISCASFSKTVWYSKIVNKWYLKLYFLAYFGSSYFGRSASWKDKHTWLIMPNLSKLGIALLKRNLTRHSAPFLKNDLVYFRVNVICHGNFQYWDQMLVCKAGSVGCLGQLHYWEHLLTWVGASIHINDACSVKVNMWHWFKE